MLVTPIDVYPIRRAVGAACSFGFHAPGSAYAYYHRPYRSMPQRPVFDEMRAMMSTFVLIHGAFHGAWCWYKVVPRLEAAGHRVVTVDLPGHGRDTTPLKGLTGNDYVDGIESVLDSLDEPAVLVGHSMGGATVSMTAERCPDRLVAAVYVAAVVPESGYSATTDPAVADLVAGFGSGAVLDEANNTLRVADELVQPVFYNECSADDSALGALLLISEPVGAMQTAVELSTERYGTVPKYGVMTTYDRLFPIARQQKMYDRGGLRKTVTMPTDHSPFFCAPDELTRHVIDFATDAVAARKGTVE